MRGHVLWAFPGHPGHTVQLRGAQRQEGVPEGRPVGRRWEAGPSGQNWGRDGGSGASRPGRSPKASSRLSTQGHLPSRRRGLASRARSAGAGAELGKSRAPWPLRVGGLGGPGGPDGTAPGSSPGARGRGGAANEFQEVSCEGPEAHKPFTGVSGGETRMQPFIYSGFHFSLLFLTCASRSVTGF